MGTTADYRNFWARTGHPPRARYERRDPVPQERPALTLPAEDTGPAEPLSETLDDLMDAAHAALGWFETHPDVLEESARLWVVPMLQRVLRGEEAGR